MKVADLCVPRRITVRGMFADRLVDAWTLGDWAAHRQVGSPHLWGLTLMPLGMSLPFAWCSFRTPGKAVGAMREIARVRNDWAAIAQDDFTRALERRLRAIASSYGAIEGPLQLTVPADRGAFGPPALLR